MMTPKTRTNSKWVGALVSSTAFAIIAGAAFAQSAFVKVGPETLYDAGDRCGVPYWDVADFNRDGRPDFALSGYPNNVYVADPSQWKPSAVMLWIAQPDGSYKEMATQMFSGPVTAAYASQLRVGDFNGDGIPDIYLPSYGLDNSTATPDTPKLALSTPAGFIDASARFAGLAPRLTHTGAIADIDGNGTVDIYVGSNTGAPVPGKKPYLLLNDGRGNFTFDQSRLPAVVLAQQPAQGARAKQLDANTWYVADERFTGSQFVDVDRDGFPDLVLVPTAFAPNGFVLLNDGHGDFSKRPPIELPPGVFGGNWLIAKLENGGWFASTPTRAPGPGTIHLDTRAVDLNGDGYPDLVILQTLHQDSPDVRFYRNGRIQILINQGGRGFVDETAVRGAPGFDAPRNYDYYGDTLTVADVNGDGFPDLIAVRGNGDYTPHVYLNDGNGRFTRTTLPGIPENGLFIVVSGGFQQPTRIVNIRFNYKPGPTGPVGCTLAVQTYERPAPAIVNFQGMWAVPKLAEAGWGINFTHQADILFGSWFTYDASGKPWWMTMSAQQQSDGAFTGAIDATSGPAFSAQPFDPARVTHQTVGTGRVTFSSAKNGTFAYTVNGISQVKPIELFQFAATVPTCTFNSAMASTQAVNYTDMWAVPNLAEAGWGVNFTHQGDTIFASWFTYDESGKPLWVTATLTKTAARSFSGPLDATTGPPFSSVPFDPSRVTHITVGTANLTFADGANGTFAYTMNGISQSKSIARFTFRAPGTVCQ